MNANNNVVSLSPAVPGRQLSNVVFGVSFFPQNHAAQVWPPTDFTPSMDGLFRFEKDKLKLMLIWSEGIVKKNLIVFGPTGSGKSSLVCQYAARTGKAVYRLACNGKTQTSELFGHLGLVQDSQDGPAVMRYQPGPVLNAMKAGGILLLDEGDTLHPSVAVGLNGVLDGAPYLVPETGELVKPHPDFRVAITSNTAGQGDDTGGYRGTQRQNIAYLDRFLALEVNYLSSTEEALLLVNALQVFPEARRIDGKAIETIVLVAGDVREAFLEGVVDIPISTRGTVDWAKTACLYGGDLTEAIKPVVTQKARPEHAGAILGMLQRRLNPDVVF